MQANRAKDPDDTPSHAFEPDAQSNGYYRCFMCAEPLTIESRYLHKGMACCWRCLPSIASEKTEQTEPDEIKAIKQVLAQATEKYGAAVLSLRIVALELEGVMEMLDERDDDTDHYVRKAVYGVLKRARKAGQL